MKNFKVTNENYCAVVVTPTIIHKLDNCDNVVAAIIMGNQVIVSAKDTPVGTLGIFFPVECKLSPEYLKANNLYRKEHLNADPTQKGYFEENGRVKCVKFRGNKSEGLFMPMKSLSFVTDEIPEVGKEFNEIDGTPICEKYIPKGTKTPGSGNAKKGEGRKAKESKLIDKQFAFHQNTSMLYKNLHMIKPETIISITYKLHGTSGISSKILCKKKLNWGQKLLKWLGVQIVDTEYDYIYSSRKVIKNSDLNPNAVHFYNVDIWGLAHKRLEPLLDEGMTLYYEIVGYLPSGEFIQKGFDYGCEVAEFEIYVYRITTTNISGKVVEFPYNQVKAWCTKFDVKAVPPLFHGRAGDLSDERLGEEKWGLKFLETVKERYNEKDCYMCNHLVPEEGCVVRVEDGLDFEAYKCKSTRFYELETKELDKGQVDIETEN